VSERRALVFDMDGTLLWLDVAIEEVRAALFALFAPLGHRGEFRPLLPAIEAAADAVAAAPAERARWRARGRDLVDAAEVAAASRARPRAGAAACVRALAERQFTLGVVTDNGRACAPLALRTALGADAAHLSAVVSRDDVARPKPDPEGLVRAAGALLPAGGALCFVGDTARDVETARQARPLLQAGAIELRCVALAGGRGRPEELAAAGPDARIAELAELAELVS
jgi:phosphoglycolate phosphatase